ncbi:TPA: ead/Ea22-like family protein [Pseudomonas aeruginosa]
MDEPLFNELLESVKQADQIMTDHAELRRVAEDVIRIERSEDEPISSAWELFDSAANPKTVLALLDEIDRLKAENDRLRQGMKGDYDIDAWLDWLKEKERIKAENDALRGALQAVEAEVDGNLRPLTRDLVNMVSGLKNGSHPNDIYEHCDEIERIIGAALEGDKP